MIELDEYNADWLASELLFANEGREPYAPAHDNQWPGEAAASLAGETGRDDEIRYVEFDEPVLPVNATRRSRKQSEMDKFEAMMSRYQQIAALPFESLDLALLGIERGHDVLAVGRAGVEHMTRVLDDFAEKALGETRQAPPVQTCGFCDGTGHEVSEGPVRGQKRIELCRVCQGSGRVELRPARKGAGVR